MKRQAYVGHDATVPTDEYRRTRLANERTFLAWWRTGLASYAVAIAIGRFLPQVVSGPTWQYATLGVIFALTGSVTTAFGWWRWSEVEASLPGGEAVGAPRWLIASLSLTGTLSALAVALVIIAAA